MNDAQLCPNVFIIGCGAIGKTLAVLYVKNIGNADVKRQDLFLDSFHFGAAS